MSFKVHDLEHSADCKVNDALSLDLASKSDCNCGAVIDRYEAELKKANERAMYWQLLAEKKS